MGGMRGLKNRKKLSRKTSHRLAMLRNMVTSLIKHERIKTTTPKAKVLKPYAEKLIRYAKVGTDHSMKLAAAIVREQMALFKLFQVLGPRYAERNGGYTRIIKLAKPRKGDNAQMALIEFIDRDGELRVPKLARGVLGVGEKSSPPP
eukprot:CAMPEP_0197306018 /NCGR_PEP_ID=MMETSP0891-20130614/2475_1 /TAXON_ID=44058 ORGANISM="Aureoumbra lagunensis, Strain CCMP1510" /NCGR_SAMPLE_ID=MMETSP0891 /ASSEMBLY_ACC=CAM_ASM_000534 /LENGTH=146 /DNA_ID=CAMNT_0042787719 /DNA_START=35 /DNA_END=475 /DNA_ORIENTATION=+